MTFSERVDWLEVKRNAYYKSTNEFCKLKDIDLIL